MDFIRTIVHGVRDVRSRVRQPGTGRMADAGKPVITIIEHKPGYWAAYGVQTLICALLMLAGVGGIVWVALQRTHGPLRVADLLFTPFGLMSAIGAMLPVYFLRRFQLLRRVFDAADEHLEPTGGDPGAAPTPDKGYETDDEITEAALEAALLEEQHPNFGSYTDPVWILLTALLLMATAVLQLAVGCHLSFTIVGAYAEEELIFDLREPLWFVFGAAQLVQCGLNTVLGFMVANHRPRATALALLLAVINLGLALLTLHPLAIGLAAVLVFGLVLATYGFRRMNERIAQVTQEDALVVYYHNLMLALVHVMRADGRCDRAELRKITRLCNQMNLSTYEQTVVQEAANVATPEPIQTVVSRYLEAARLLELAEPELSLLLCGYAVAGADGALVPAEVTALEELTHAMNAWPASLLTTLTELESPQSLTVVRARALLNVGDNPSAAELDAEYARLSAMLAALSFDHLGAPLADIAKGHGTALKRAHELLRNQPDAGQSSQP